VLGKIGAAGKIKSIGKLRSMVRKMLTPELTEIGWETSVREKSSYLVCSTRFRNDFSNPPDRAASKRFSQLEMYRLS